MITRINWTDDFGNPRRDVVLATFVHEGFFYVVVAFNNFTIVQFDPTRSSHNLTTDEPYQELFSHDR